LTFQFPNAPLDGDVYAHAGGSSFVYDGTDGVWRRRSDVGSVPLPFVTIGDVKSGFQTDDHNGWIKLDGRDVTTLTLDQQAAAASLGFTANLPNGELCGLRQDSAAGPGVVGGSPKISQAQLPNISVVSAGDHNHMAYGNVGSQSQWDDYPHQSQVNWHMNHSGPWQNGGSYWNHYLAANAGAHQHSLGGSGADYYAKAIVVSFFVYLGA
jgi:hypothetical protein